MTPEHRRHHGRHFFIPAGILIGLGIGMLVNYPAPGVLIGLGLGFVASAFDTGEAVVPQDTTGTISRTRGTRWMSLIIGLIIIVLGIGLVWAPLNIWPYVIGLFLILFGLWFIARGYGWTK